MKKIKCDVRNPDKRVYNIWRNMMYNHAVCDSWRAYSNFERDIKTLPGYGDWVNSKEYWFTHFPGSNVYSKDTCCFIHKANVLRSAAKILTPEEIEEAYKMWCNGYTQQEIADKFFVSDRTIRRAFNGRKKIRKTKETEK